MKKNFEETKKILYAALGYHFSNETIFHLALTHRSTGALSHNERLEFLGDAIVNCVIAECLYLQFPNAKEGELSRLRASLVNRQALAMMGQYFNLGAYLLLGLGEEKSGGRTRQSILSCAMEAMIGAIYLDGGYDAIKNCLLNWYKKNLASLSLNYSHKDPKTCLQELMQAIAAELPHYEVILAEGEAHDQTFTVKCTIHYYHLTTHAMGKSRKSAEQAAAEAMLEKVNTLRQTEKTHSRETKRIKSKRDVLRRPS